MQSHPDYPFLVALTDSLDEMGVEYAAVVADKDHLHELSYPVLAYINTKERSDFVQVSKPERFLENGFADQWEGICLYIKKGATVCNAEHDKWFGRERRSDKLQAWSLTAIMVVLVGAIAFHFTLIGLLLQGLSIAGAIICGLIVLHSMGKGNAVTEQLCDANGVNGCDKVLHSKVAKWRGVGLDDAGLIYFIGLSLFIAAVSFNSTQFPAALSLLTVMAGIALLVSLGSIVYQWKIVKSWCRMCLVVSGVLWLQALVVYINQPNYFAFSFFHVGVLVISLSIPAIVWMNTKPLVLRIDELSQKEINGLKFKRDPEVFLTLLLRQRKVNTAFWEHEIVLGNPDAPLQLMVACNPYCWPCANAHKQLEELLKLYPTKICIGIRFTIRTTNVSDRKLVAASSIASAFIGGNRNAVDEWFLQMDLEAFDQLHSKGADEYLVKSVLQRHEDWAKEAMISHTPTVFMNSYELPKQYRINDLQSMIYLILENITPLSAVANAGR